MKILQILPTLEHNGISRSALELSKALVKAEHESVVVAETGELTSRLEKDGGIHIDMPFRKSKLSSLWQTRKLRKVILEQNPDIIHLRARMPAWITHLALKTIPTNERPMLVSTIHDLYTPSRYSQSMLKTDYVISVSDFVHQYLIKNFPEFNPNKHSRIYRGINSKAYPYLYQPSVHWWNNILAEFPELDNKIWLTVVGSVLRSKGHQWLIDIIGGLKEQYPNIHAVIIGNETKDPSYTDELKCLIRALGLNEHFTFTGSRNDIREWLSSSNIVLALEDKPRSFGRTILESVSMGKPVIGWSHGGVKEILTEIYPEGLIEKGDCLALIEAIRQTIDDPKRPEKSNYFLLKNATKETIDLYESLINNKKEFVKTHSKAYRNLPEASNIINSNK